MKDVVIIANGPFLHRDIILEAMNDRFVIVLDGALNQMRWCDSSRIHCILGDFDSVDRVAQDFWGISDGYDDITNDSTPYRGLHDVLIVPSKNQEYTDLEKAIQFCDRNHTPSITLVCASGGRSDHDEAVKQAIRYAYKPERPITLHTDQQSLRYAKDEVVYFDGHIGDACGFISRDAGSCVSDGLLYPCASHTKSFCNQLSADTASLTVTGEALLFLPPQLPSQRAFMAKSDSERLALLLHDAEDNASYYFKMNFFNSFS